MFEFFADLLTIQFAYAVGIVFLGGILHGYTGWGGGLVMMPLLTLIYSPVEALMIAAIGGLLLMARMYPQAIRTANWLEMRPLYLVMLVATPLGGLLLLIIDPGLVRKVIGCIIVTASLLIMSGWQYRGTCGVAAASIFGCISGVVNGFAGVGGPFFVIYIIAHPDEPSVQRANIIIAAGLQILLIVVTLAATGAVSWDVFLLGLILAPAQFLSGLIGVRIFALAPQEMYKKFTLIAIVILGASVVIF